MKLERNINMETPMAAEISEMLCEIKTSLTDVMSESSLPQATRNQLKDCLKSVEKIFMVLKKDASHSEKTLKPLHAGLSRSTETLCPRPLDKSMTSSRSTTDLTQDVMYDSDEDDINDLKENYLQVIEDVTNTSALNENNDWDNNNQGINEAKPVTNKTKLELNEAKPVTSELKPELNEAKLVTSEHEPELNQVKAVKSELKRELNEAKPVTKPEREDAKPETNPDKPVMRREKEAGKNADEKRRRKRDSSTLFDISLDDLTEPDHSGMLQEKHSGNEWWCVLQDQHLCMFPSQNPQELAYDVLLVPCCEISLDDIYTDSPVFRLTQVGSTPWVFSAGIERNLRAWIRALYRASGKDDAMFIAGSKVKRKSEKKQKRRDMKVFSSTIEETEEEVEETEEDEEERKVNGKSGNGDESSKSEEGRHVDEREGEVEETDEKEGKVNGMSDNIDKDVSKVDQEEGEVNEISNIEGGRQRSEVRKEDKREEVKINEGVVGNETSKEKGVGQSGSNLARKEEAIAEQELDDQTNSQTTEKSTGERYGVYSEGGCLAECLPCPVMPRKAPALPTQDPPPLPRSDSPPVPADAINTLTRQKQATKQKQKKRRMKVVRWLRKALLGDDGQNATVIGDIRMQKEGTHAEPIRVWCLFRNKKLMCFRDVMSADVEMVIPLDGCSVVPESEGSEAPYRFWIEKNDAKICTFFARAPKERQKWMEVLRNKRGEVLLTEFCEESGDEEEGEGMFGDEEDAEGYLCSKRDNNLAPKTLLEDDNPYAVPSQLETEFHFQHQNNNSYDNNNNNNNDVNNNNNDGDLNNNNEEDEAYISILDLGEDMERRRTIRQSKKNNANLANKSHDLGKSSSTEKVNPSLPQSTLQLRSHDSRPMAIVPPGIPRTTTPEHNNEPWSGQDLNHDGDDEDGIYETPARRKSTGQIRELSLQKPKKKKKKVQKVAQPPAAPSSGATSTLERKKKINKTDISSPIADSQAFTLVETDNDDTFFTDEATSQGEQANPTNIALSFGGQSMDSRIKLRENLLTKERKEQLVALEGLKKLMNYAKDKMIVVNHSNQTRSDAVESEEEYLTINLELVKVKKRLLDIETELRELRLFASQNEEENEQVKREEVLANVKRKPCLIRRPSKEVKVCVDAESPEVDRKAFNPDGEKTSSRKVLDNVKIFEFLQRTR